MAKRKVDTLNQGYNESSDGTQLFTAVIPTNVYGAFDNFSLRCSHVVPGLIHKSFLSAMDAKLKGSEKAVLKVCGSGKPIRQFISAFDLGRLIIWVLENYNDTQPLILCPDEADEISINQVAEIICKIMSDTFNVEQTIEHDTSKSDGQFKKTASNKKFRELYPDFVFTPFEVGVKQAIDWFCQNYPNVRK